MSSFRQFTGWILVLFKVMWVVWILSGVAFGALAITMGRWGLEFQVLSGMAAVAMVCLAVLASWIKTGRVSPFLKPKWDKLGELSDIIEQIPTAPVSDTSRAPAEEEPPPSSGRQ